MNMTKATNRVPILLITACIIFGVGLICLAGILLLQPPAHYFKGILYISFAFMTFGLGEFLNHPKERIITAKQENTSDKTEFQRRRNVCSLGNLCDICSMLLFFIGLSTLLFAAD